MDRLLQEGGNEFEDLCQVESEKTVTVLVPVVLMQLEMISKPVDLLSAEATYLLRLQQQLMFPLTQSQDS